MRRLFLAALLALAAAPAFADPIDIGPAVGDKIPALAARGIKGEARDLSSVAGAKGATLVFFRSARWCPFCQKQLVELKAVSAELAAAGYPVVAISYDPPEALATFAEKQGVAYTLLSDEGSKMIDAFKLRDAQYPAGSFAYGVPRPSIFIVDRGGVVRAKLAEDGYKVRPTNQSITEAVGRLK